MEKSITLDLRTPERTPLPDGSFLMNPKEVEEWISGLPMANIGETSRQVFKTFVEFNRREIPNVSRLKISEQFRRPIGYISDNLKRYYYESAFPLSAKSRRIAVLNRELYMELAIAYKIFIENELAGTEGKPDFKLLVVAIHRAMSSLLSVLYQSVIVYDPFPAGVWREIHSLYAYAEQNEIHEQTVRTGGEVGFDSTVCDLYNQALLFAISSPYRLRQREIEYTYNHLPEWASQLTLGRPDAKGQSDTLFISRLDTDAPPSHIKQQREPVGARCRQLNTRLLIRMLKGLFDDLPQEYNQTELLTTEELISKHLLRKLIKVLRATPKRQFVRTKLNFELRTVVGISDIHALLNETQKELTEESESSEDDWFIGSKEEKSSFNTPHQNSPGSSDPTLELVDGPTEETIVITGTNPVYYDEKQSMDWTTDADQQETSFFACKTDNESAGGYCVLWHGPNAPKIKNGEIMGFQSFSEKHQFGIGISRWLKNIPGQGLQVGMELVSLNSTAVSASFAEPDEFSSGPQRCLLLPEVTRLGQPATLIAPPLPFKVDDLVLIDNRGEQQLIRLTRIQESTGAFSQFQFMREDHPKRENNEEIGGGDTDFENIWTTL